MESLMSILAAVNDAGMGIAGVGVGMGLAVMGAGWGIGRIGGQAVEGIARQPEAMGKIVPNMIIAAALVEGVAFTAIILSFLLTSNRGRTGPPTGCSPEAQKRLADMVKKAHWIMPALMVLAIASPLLADDSGSQQPGLLSDIASAHLGADQLCDPAGHPQPRRRGSTVLWRPQGARGAHPRQHPEAEDARAKAEATLKEHAANRRRRKIKSGSFWPRRRPTPRRSPPTSAPRPRPKAKPSGRRPARRSTLPSAKRSGRSTINVAEITSILKREIAGFEQRLQINEVGTVIEVGDGIARIYGLRNAMAGELLEFQNGVMGQVFNLEEDSIGAVIFGDYLSIKEGDSVKSTGRLLEVPVGDAVIGRVVNPLGQPLDGGPAIPSTETRKMDIVAPGIADRQPVKEPLQTGIKAIDSMIPIGRGQRELIIGDRKTGKTAIALDTIINQKGTWALNAFTSPSARRNLPSPAGRRSAQAPRRDGIHDGRRRRRRRSRPDAVHRPLRRLRDGRILHVEGPGHAVRL
jgi:ATP synthase F0 subunit c